MLVVLDTNVFLSALLAPQGMTAEIYKAWRPRRFEVATCTEQIEELRRASRYPKFRAALQPHRFGRLINNLTRARVYREALPKLLTAEDPSDSFLLNLAAVSNADYLVTGDKRSGILELSAIGRTRILTVRAFCETVLSI